MRINFSNTFVVSAALWLAGIATAVGVDPQAEQLHQPAASSAAGTLAQGVEGRLTGLGEALVHSGAREGRSTHVRFPKAVERHQQRLAARVASVHSSDASDPRGEGGPKGDKKEDEDASVDSFLDAYGDVFGVTRAQLRKSKVLEDGAGESRFYHLEQYIDGYRVFGGSVVVSLDGLNGVLGAHGHPMPESAIEDRYRGVKALGVTGVLAPITSYLQETSSVTKEYGSIVEGGCDSSTWVTETVWYRQDIILGGEGYVNLVDRVEGTCAFVGGRVMYFEGFVDLRSKEVMALYDKTSGFLKLKQGMLRDVARHLRGSEGAAALVSAADSITTTTNTPAAAHSAEAMRSAASSAAGAMGPEPQSSRRLQMYPGLTIEVRNHNSGAILFDNSYNSIPSGFADLKPSIEYTVATNYLFKSLSNQQWLSYKQSAAALLIRLYLNEFNAYYDGTQISIGNGLAVDDVVPHEWAHGYTDFSSNLVYSYQSGAINEAMSDIFGESVDMLKTDTSLRSSTQKCTSEAWAYRALPTGPDNTRRWLMGEDISYPSQCSLCAIRDMYYPECFGDPSTTSSSKYYCGTGDNGGVHYNSGVINRLYALIVDGGVQGTSTITGLGLTKSLNLFWKLQLAMASSTQFSDLGTILNNLCSQSIGGTLYTPNIATGASVVSPLTLSTSDCTQVSNAISAVGLSVAVCPQSCVVTYPSWIGDGYCDKTGAYNTASCGWDGGDCCPQSCVSKTYSCGVNGYDCKDPSYTPTARPTSAPSTAVPTRNPTAPTTSAPSTAVPTRDPTAPPSTRNPTARPTTISPPPSRAPTSPSLPTPIPFRVPTVKPTKRKKKS